MYLRFWIFIPNFNIITFTLSIGVILFIIDKKIETLKDALKMKLA